MKGWVPAYRTLFERDDFLAPSRHDPACNGYAWLYLVQLAQHGEYEHGSERLGRGEFLISTRRFADRMGWSKSRSNRFLNRLICGTMIGTVRGTPHGTVYRIMKYDTYAVGENSARDTGRDTGRDASGTAAGQQRDNNKKGEQTTKTKYTSDFEELWTCSRRGSKKTSFGLYRKLVPSKVSHSELVAARQRHVAEASGERFVKHLERWLRDERWVEQTPEPVELGQRFYTK